MFERPAVRALARNPDRGRERGAQDESGLTAARIAGISEKSPARVLDLAQVTAQRVGARSLKSASVIASNALRAASICSSS